MQTASLAADDRLFDPAWWRAEFPELSLEPEAGVFAAPNGPGREPLAQARERMRTEGYLQARDERLAEWAPRLAAAVARMQSRGLPPPFVFLFDEAWAAFHRLHGQLADILGPRYQILPDFWAWHIEPSPSGAGWTPHRDRGYRSLGVGRAPLSLTVWIPLTAATPANSCMYILPADRDPTYGTPQDGRYDVDLASVRALPAEPGDYLIWNQAVLHWGSRASRLAETPRMSMALEFQRGDVSPLNAPLMAALARPAFEDRLKLVAKQILQYRHMYPLTPEMESLAQAIQAR
jgi:hypothetical protein